MTDKQSTEASMKDLQMWSYEHHSEVVLADSAIEVAQQADNALSDANARIAELEKENSHLKSLLENVRSESPLYFNKNPETE